MRRAIALAVLLICSAGCDVAGLRLENRYIEREERHYTTSGRPELVLTTFDGAIDVQVWDKPEVQVVVEKRGINKNAIDAIEVLASQSGNRIEIEVKSPRHRGIHFGVSPSAKLAILVPASSDVSGKSGDGSITVEGVKGHLDLHTADGHIRVTDTTGEVNANTADGRINLDGRFTIVTARSGDGRVTIRAEKGTDPSGDWDISSGDGAVTLDLPDGFNGDLDASTGDGRLRVEGLALTGSVAGDKHRLQGRLGGGGHAIRVRTGDGSVTLRRS